MVDVYVGIIVMDQKLGETIYHRHEPTWTYKDHSLVLEDGCVEAIINDLVRDYFEKNVGVMRKALIVRLEICKVEHKV